MKISLKYFLLFILIGRAYSGNFTVTNITQFQSALNTASANSQHDTINVLAGTYNVNPTLIYTSSENYTIFIKGSGSPSIGGGNARRVLQLSSMASNGDIIIDGLIIHHGIADYGGGLNILTQDADVMIRNCSFTDNTAGNVAGGLNIFSNTGNVSVTNCSFLRNASPNNSGYPLGTAGGLFVQTDGANTSITVYSCTFGQNTAQRDAAGAMLYPLGINSTVIADNNSFTGNTAKEFGGGCWIRCPGGNSIVRARNNILNGNNSSTEGSGGGAYIQITSGLIEYNNNNHTGNNAAWQGGGLWIEHGGGIMNIYKNTFYNNTSSESGGGANIFLENGTLKLDHNIFNKNRTTGPGGGSNLSTTTGNLIIFNNTFYTNRAADGGDINLYFDNSASSINFYNNILYNSSIPSLSFSGQQNLIARYSNIYGGAGQPWFGTGCIDTYPFFRDTASADFHLQDSIQCSNTRYSRCIDAGDPSISDSIINCYSGLGSNRSDMGVYGGKYYLIGINKYKDVIPKEYKLHQNYPNPFNPTTKLRFAVKSAPKEFLGKLSNVKSKVQLLIYNSFGQLIKTLADEELNAGTYEVEFDGSTLASGVYFYRLQVMDGVQVLFNETRKMVLLK